MDGFSCYDGQRPRCDAFRFCKWPDFLMISRFNTLAWLYSFFWAFLAWTCSLFSCSSTLNHKHETGRKKNFAIFFKSFFLQPTTVIWVSLLRWPADCPQSPCITAGFLPLLMTKRRAAPAPHFITRGNATAQWCMELVSLRLASGRNGSTNL